VKKKIAARPLRQAATNSRIEDLKMEKLKKKNICLRQREMLRVHFDWLPRTRCAPELYHQPAR
jgi:hypothetical protein